MFSLAAFYQAYNGENASMLTQQKRIEIVTYDDALLLDIFGPVQVFAIANEFASRDSGFQPYDCHVVSRNERIKTSGIEISTMAFPDVTCNLDTLMVVGGNGYPAACSDGHFIDWFRQRAIVSRRVASVCTGAFILAKAGILNKKLATTHWRFCQDFSAEFPDVVLQPDRIFTRDGNVWTSAGVTAGIDLSLALVEEDLGRKASLAIAQYLVMFLKRPGGQSQFSMMLSMQADDRFDRLHAWIAENLEKDLSLETLAGIAGMSGRSFSRHYKEATGKTPSNAVEQIRVDTARRMLENGTSLAKTASKCGFLSNETMRRAFLRSVGVGPADYLDRFGPAASKPV